MRCQENFYLQTPSNLLFANYHFRCQRISELYYWQVYVMRYPFYPYLESGACKNSVHSAPAYWH